MEREQAESKLANIEWKRVGKGDASSLTLREPQLAQARAVLAAAEAAYEQSKRNLRRTVILAPFDGRVRKKMVVDSVNWIDPGEKSAQELLKKIRSSLVNYNEQRNDPNLIL